MRLFRIILFFVTVLVLGVAAVAVMPEAKHKRFPTEVVFESFGGPDGWQLPRGWVAVDPFSTGTPYYGLLWYHQTPYFGSRVALVKRTQDPAELLLMVAPRDAVIAGLVREADRFRGHPQVELRSDLAVSTASGESVTLHVARVKNPVHAEGDTTYVLGSAPVGDDLMLVINGGALTEVFDLAEIEQIIESLNVPGAPLSG